MRTAVVDLSSKKARLLRGWPRVRYWSLSNLQDAFESVIGPTGLSAEAFGWLMKRAARVMLSLRYISASVLIESEGVATLRSDAPRGA
jgi:hypothetical protein